MTYVAKLSLPGYDVKTAAPEQCAIHSSYPPLKSKLGQPSPHSATVVVDFTSGITQNSTLTVYSISHGYGYIPFNLSNIVLSGIDSFSTSYTITGIGFAGVGATLAIDAYCTSTNFIVTVYDNANWINNTATLQVSYDIYAESGT